MSKGIELIASERQRQMEQEGWTAEHDDRHNDGALAHAAAVYASDRVDVEDVWPWPDEPPKVKDELSNLMRAGALIAAEIDRLYRVRVSSTYTHPGPEVES